MFQKIIRGQLQGFQAQKWSLMTLQDLQGCLKLLDGKASNVSFLIVIYKSIRLWDVKTGQQKQKLDGDRYYDNSILLWDVKKGLQNAQIDGHIHIVFQVCFSPDGNTLASGSSDKSIRLWNVKTGQQKAQIDGHTSEVLSVCFSPDGNTLASGSNDNSFLLWDVKKGKEIFPADKPYKDLLVKLKAPLFQNNPLLLSSNITILQISQTKLFQVQGTLIFKGDYINFEGDDLKSLFKSKGSCFLDDLKQK
ncbi:unnamed protein product [Paramecium pentaurelia]|uniref:Uncharacterized protein n=1 Tax=Paramecium pentaurelia TaxID=43138 RepID=A0A8S1VQ55_9CILI|nr:unnamed protein product [Paramecium pentaurelia]